jgi:putative DNA primase/helicase
VTIKHNPNNPLLEAALAYREMGWSPIPCTPNAKTPLISWGQFQVRQASETAVRRWWETWPMANVGVVMGPISGMVGLDLDGDATREWFAMTTLGSLPVTLMFRTPRGRRHLFAIPTGATIGNHVLVSRPGCEVRVLGVGSYSVFPPSRTDRGVYEWVQGRAPGQVGLCSAPTWVVTPQKPAPKPPTETGQVRGGEETIPEGRRNEVCFRAGCAARGAGCDAAEVLFLLRLINRRCRPPLSEDDLRTITRSVLRYVPEPHIPHQGRKS